MTQEKPHIRIGNVSGATGDHSHAMARMLRSGNVHVITGDWLSEMNIAWNAITKQEVDGSLGYEDGFYQQLEECIDDIVAKDIRVVTNAGALNVMSLYNKVKRLYKERGHDCFKHLDHPEMSLDDWEFTPCTGNANIGSWGTTAALRAGANIVLCGRCTHAAAWYYGWKKDSFDELAGSLLAAHLIECGPYVVGANFSGFKDFLYDLVDLAFPIAEIDYKGGSHVPEGTVTAQLLYELQGHLYLNPDVVADLSAVSVKQQSTDRVRVTAIKGLPPPGTTKAMIAGKGGYQAEATSYINSFDVAEKAKMMKNQLYHIFQDSRFSKLSIGLYGTQADNPTSQQAALMPVSLIDHRVQISTGEVIKVDQPKVTATYPVVRPSADTAEPADLLSFGSTKLAPLGSIVHVRSGDKGDSSNVGFFVRDSLEYPWLRTLLSVDKLKQLLGDDWHGGNPNRRVERIEFPNINAVLFRILDNLNGGIASSDRIDGLGKGVAEYLRSKYVDVPKIFLENGRI
ncbi:hypothetical protein HDV64DRAFT_273550 [Trichoderma sp. TUCIM 5745]